MVGPLKSVRAGVNCTFLTKHKNTLNARTQSFIGTFIKGSSQLESTSYPSSIPWKNALVARSCLLLDLIRETLLLPPYKPRNCHFKIKVKQGKGTADHLMPLGYLFQLKRSLSTNISQPVINLKFTC